LPVNTIGRALRLLDTQQAGLGTWLAVAALLVSGVVVLRLAYERRLRVVVAVAVLGAGALAGAGIVQTTYHAWYNHRCVEHGSDIPECSAPGHSAPGVMHS
jgi:hypothetical protein